MSYGDLFYGEGGYGLLLGGLDYTPGEETAVHERTRILHTNIALTATVTASASVADRPVSFLKNAARWKKWRSTTTTGDQWAAFEFTEQTVTVVALVDYRAHTGGSIAAEYWDGAAWQDLGTFALPSFNPTRVVAIWIPDGVTTTKVRVYFDNAASASGYVELGAVLIGEYLEPASGYVDGFEIVPVDPSVRRLSIDGQMEAQTRTTYHVSRGGFTYLDDDDRVRLARAFAAVGMHRPLLLAIDPGDPHTMLYCVLAELPYQHVHQGFYNIPVSVEEVR